MQKAQNISPQSLLQNSGWMIGNPTSSPFSRWNDVHGGSMDRNFNSDKKAEGRLDACKGGAQALRANGLNQMGRGGEADRRSRVLQEAPQRYTEENSSLNPDLFSHSIFSALSVVQTRSLPSALIS